MVHFRDQVVIDLEGRVVCPQHGALDLAQEFEAGLACCGCQFVAVPGGALRAVRGSEPANGVAVFGCQVTNETANSGLQSCGIPA